MGVRLPRRLSNLFKLTCPKCRNDHLLLIVDFGKKWQGEENYAFCVKKVIKNVLGVPTVRGCGLKFKLEVLPRYKGFPPL